MSEVEVPPRTSWKYFWKNLSVSALCGAFLGAASALRAGGFGALRAHIVARIAAVAGTQRHCYALWVRRHVKGPEELSKMHQQSVQLPYKPTFSLLMRSCNTEEHALTHAVESVLAQAYPYWELLVVHDIPVEMRIQALFESYQARDSRVKSIVWPSQGALPSAPLDNALSIAEGEFICLMGNNDEISPDALFQFARYLNCSPATDMIYSDEDRIRTDGGLFEPFFKPDWSPEYAEAFMYTGRLACYRTDLARRAGGFRPEYASAWEYDFMLRFIEKTQKIGHVADILYHRSASAPGAADCSEEARQNGDDLAAKALRDRLKRLKRSGAVLSAGYPGCFETRYDVTGHPLVSIVIPSAGKSAKLPTGETDMLSNCVNSISTKTTYSNYEIVVVDNNDLAEHTLRAIERNDCRFVHYEGPVNIAAKMNLGARHARGEYFLFLNDDVEVISPDWLEVMLQIFERPNVGVVGAKLYFGDRTIQHVGVVLTHRGIPEHVLRGTSGSSLGYFFSSVTNRNYLAVTGACLMTRKDVFEKLEGFNCALAINYNDIDYCLRVHEAGLRIVFAAQAELFHYEAKTGRAMTNWHDHNLFKELWGFETKSDPYYNVNLRTDPPNFQLKL